MTIGQQLLTPEIGWKRYDNANITIKYTNIPVIANNANFYNNTAHYTASSNNSKIEFSFIGTKLRIITGISSGYSQTPNTINIDDIDYTYSTYHATISGQMYIVSEFLNLENKAHRVIITPPDTVPFGLDAIDIDLTGRLMHIDEVINPQDLAIGKRIRCNYKVTTTNTVGVFSGLGLETKDFIPPISSATPDGDFYYLCTDIDHLGRWKTVADRNIQRNISWDVLNASGIASGSGLPTDMLSSVIKPMTSNSQDGQIVSASNNETSWEAFKLFDKKIDSAGWISTSQTGWVIIDLGIGKKISGYTVSHRVSTILTSPPKNWTLYGSVDGIVWDSINVITNQTSWTSGQTRSFKIGNELSSYQYYKFDFTANNGDGQLIIGELDLLENLNINSLFTTRLLTGGTSVTDKDNEWDKYIVESTLNGTIMAGDDIIWNWKGDATYPAYSLTSTTANTGSDRTLRGNTTVSTFTYGASNNTSNLRGFRPVLLVESLFIPFLFKSLILFNNEYKKWNNGWQTVSTVTPTIDIFKTEGMDSLTSLNRVENYSPFDEFAGNFEIVSWTDDPAINSIGTEVKLKPQPQTVVSKNEISLLNVYDVNSFEFISQEANNGKIKYALSIDNGLEWLTFKNDNFTSMLLNEINTDGLTTTEINSITSEKWNALFAINKKIKFAYYLEADDVDDSVIVDELILNYASQGTWGSTSQGTEYSYSYPNNEELRIKLYQDGDYKINYYKQNPAPGDKEELLWEEFSL